MTEATLFEGGQVYTGRRYVEALLVEDGRVAAAGRRDEVARNAPTGADRVRLNGALVVPGLVDAHLHLAELARAREGASLDGVRSTGELVDRLAAWARERPPTALVLRGLDLAGIPTPAWPTARELDRAVDDRPVLIYDRTGHVAILNSRALEQLDLSGEDAEALAADIGREADGSPDGILREEAMRRFGSALAERNPPSPEAWAQAVDHLASLGLTMLGALSSTPEELRALGELARQGPAPIPRVRAYVRLSRFRELGPAASAERRDVVAVVGVKAFLDGAFGPRTASLFEPYTDLPSSRGVGTLGDEELVAELTDAVGRGLVPALHAIGDRAVDRAARLIDQLPSLPPGSARIEHASLTPPEVLGPLGRSRPTLVVQPGFLLSDLWLADRLGAARARWAYVFRTLGRQGLRLAASSDAPYDPADPWRGLRAAVRRTDARGRSANPEPSEALPVEEALALYTANAASALGEPASGVLEPGAPGDLVVLSVGRLEQVLGVPEPVAQTWIRGHPAYLRSD